MRLALSSRCGFAVSIVAAGAMAAHAASRSPATARRADGPAVVYASIEECHLGKLLSQMECHRAFANATAEFFEKAPRFSDRRACEALFRTCSIALPEGAARNAGRGRARAAAIDYVPRFNKVRVTVVSRDHKEAAPVLEGGPAPVRFDARSVMTENTSISPARALAAKAAWRASIDRPKAPAIRHFPATAAPGAAGPEPQTPDVDDGSPPQTYPVSGERWNDMQNRIRRNNPAADRTR